MRPAPRLLTSVFLAASLVLLVVLLPVREWLTRLVAWVETLGHWGPALLALFYVPASLLLLPASLLTLGAGYLYGLWGIPVVSAGSTLGAAAAFWAARRFARGAVERRVAGHPRFAALDRAVAAQGFRIVLLTRLSPLFPFTWLNYAYGLTRVRFRDYLLASWLGMLPGTALYVYLGSAADRLTDLAAGQLPDGGPLQTGLFVAGLAATVLATVVITRTARRALASAAPEVAAPK